MGILNSSFNLLRLVLELEEELPHGRLAHVARAHHALHSQLVVVVELALVADDRLPKTAVGLIPKLSALTHWGPRR